MMSQSEKPVPVPGTTTAPGRAGPAPTGAIAVHPAPPDHLPGLSRRAFRKWGRDAITWQSWVAGFADDSICLIPDVIADQPSL
jgi:hypothetical protein